MNRTTLLIALAALPAACSDPPRHCCGLIVSRLRLYPRGGSPSPHSTALTYST